MKNKKCKNCGTLFQPNKPLQYVCNWHCATDYAKKLNDKKEAKEWKEKKAIKKKELMTLQDWIKIAQSHFNTYIRLNDKILGNPCISCRKPLTSKYDAGHYYNANNHWNLRFDERNVHSQCVECNQHKHGNLIEYRKQLEFYFGATWLNQLDKDSQITRKFTIDEVKQIAETYKKKCKELKNI